LLLNRKRNAVFASKPKQLRRRRKKEEEEHLAAESLALGHGWD
jgi:hypothetical protein